MGDGQHAAIYTRTSFDVGGTGGITELEIGMDWHDGFVVWINGVEAVRESGTDIFSPATWDSWTDAGSGHSHEATGTLVFITVPVRIVGSVLAIEAEGKLVGSWGALKRRY